MSRGSGRLFFGLSLLFLGIVLLLQTNGILSTGQMVFPVAMTLGGVYLLYRAFFVGTTESAVFVGTFATLTGVFFVLYKSAFSAVELQRIWPVFMLFGAIALLAYGFMKGQEYRLALGVPAVVIAFLSIVFLLFSLEIVKTSFIQFVISWWPVLLVFVGVAMIWSHFQKKH
jgi:hypothetical protein